MLLTGTPRPNSASRKQGQKEKDTWRSPEHRKDWRVALLFLLPATVGFIFFAVYPVLRGIYLSFTNFRILSPPTWAGLANYRELLHDSVFWGSLRVTVYFVVLSVGFGIVISLITAVVLHRLTKSTVIRGLVILPFLISSVVAALVWQLMLDPELGIVNIALKALTGHTILFLGSSTWVIPSIAFISVWKSMGYNAILIFAGLQTIPNDIYEAARIDGAGEIRMFRKLTLPLLRPIMAMVIILTIIGAFQVFDIVAVATGGLGGPPGGPANASNVLPYYIYTTGFGEFDFGYAVTMSMALFVMLLAVTFLQMRLLRANQSDLG